MNINILKANSKKGFSLLANINRPVSPSHVTKIADSVKEIGIVRPVVVADISFITHINITYIIDGQHLYHALIRLQVDIPYVKIVIKTKAQLIETIAKLNASSKSWQLMDYIVSWGSLKPDFVKLGEYFKTYDIELCDLATILSGREMMRGGGNAHIIKKGTFSIVNEKAAVILLNCITDVLNVIPRMDRWSNKTFIQSYVTFYKNNRNRYNHNKMINYLKKNQSKFLLATQDIDKMKNLLDELF